MRLIHRLATLGIVLTTLACAENGTAQNTNTGKPTELPDKLGYSIGHDLGKRLKQDGIEVNTDRLIQGLRDGLAATAPQLSPEEMAATFDELRKGMMERQAVQQKEQAG